jgi:hypothetical protein
MAFTQQIASVNQRVQIGAEAITALGTAVAAGKLLECFLWTVGIDADVVDIIPSGHKYTNIREENTEWVALTLSGAMDYNGEIYPLASAMGSVSPAAHGSSAIAKDWIYIPPVMGTIVPQTYTVHQGDTNRARSMSYVIFTQFGYTITRKDVKTVGKMISQPLTDGITITPSPTAIALAPMLGKHFNVYIDTTSAGIGTTLYPNFLQVDFLMDAIYGMFFPINRANIGFTAHVDMAPKTTVKVKLEADSQGMGLLANLQVGQTLYLRVNGQGACIDNIQVGTITGGPTGGTFTLTYKGQTTTAIAYNAIGSAVQTALLALGGSVIPAASVTVTGSAGGPYVMQFLLTLATDPAVMTASGASFVGGTSPAITVVGPVFNTFNHDMAIKVGKPTPLGDDAGILSIEWECVIVEDPAWGSGQAQKATCTNLITAL